MGTKSAATVVALKDFEGMLTRPAGLRLPERWL